VELLPSVNCLVQLVEPPYTVISQQDIEIVNLERVGFNLKNFDMVLVFKDFSRDVHVVGSIPSDHLEDIRQWLTNSEIKYFESKMNLTWKNILKTIAADPDSFLSEVRAGAGMRTCRCGAVQRARARCEQLLAAGARALAVTWPLFPTLPRPPGRLGGLPGPGARRRRRGRGGGAERGVCARGQRCEREQ